MFDIVSYNFEHCLSALKVLSHLKSCLFITSVLMFRAFNGTFCLLWVLLNKTLKLTSRLTEQ